MRIRIAALAVVVALTLSLPARAGNYTDWWWGGSDQSGYGVNVGQQANQVFVSWFTYDEAGNGMWVVFSGTLDTVGQRVTGTFYRTTGPALGTTFDPTKVVATAVGKGTLTFTDMHHASFEWSVDGRSGTIALVRQTYGSSTIAGDYEGTTDGNLHCPGMPGLYGYPTDPTDSPVHGSATLSISVAGDRASGVANVGVNACNWNGSFAQSGQTVHVSGTTTCSSPMGPGALDLTLLVLDRAVVGWQRSSLASGCVQTEQFSMVRHN